MLANLAKITEVNVADIKDGEVKVRDLEKNVSVRMKENADL